MNTYSYRIHLKPEPDGGFTVTVPALPGCVTWGKDYEHALEMARDAIGCHLDSLVQDGLPVPVDIPPTEPVDAMIQVKSPLAT